MMVTEWFSTHQFKRWHGIDPADWQQYSKMLWVYADNMADHRQNVFQISLDLVRGTLMGEGKLQCDFSQFDRWAQVFWDTGRMDLMETGFVAQHGKGGWSSHEIGLRDFDVREASTGRSKRLSGREFLPQFLAALVDHLRHKQWLDKTIFHICDEPGDRGGPGLGRSASHSCSDKSTRTIIHGPGLPRRRVRLGPAGDEHQDQRPKGAACAGRALLAGDDPFSRRNRRGGGSQWAEPQDHSP
jgi:hypothetical protein